MWKIFSRLQGLWRTYSNLHVLRGRKGEKAAVRFLKSAGYRILDRNWRSGRYELDIIAQQGACVIFVEVKGRPSNALQSGYDAVDKKKKQALRTAIRAYLRHHRKIQHYRLDIISIDWNEKGEILSLHHYEGISLSSSFQNPANRI